MKFGREAPRFLAEHPDDGVERRLYLTTANEGVWHREGTERLVAALREHAPATLRWTYVPVHDSETHGTLFHPMALDAFRTLYGTPTREYRAQPLIGGPPSREDTAEEAARAAVECTRENSRPTTPGAAAAQREAIYQECLLLDLDPRPHEGTLDR